MMEAARETYNMAAAYAKVKPRASLIEVLDAENDVILHGGGIVADHDVVLTCAHIIIDKQWNHSIKVSLDKVPYWGTIEDIDLNIDLAIVKVEDLGVEPIKMGSSISAEPGEDVLCVGFPKLPRVYATRGIISCEQNTQNILGRKISYVQHDAVTEPGSSGAAIVNNKGELLGIHSFSGGPGFGYAVPVESALQFLNNWKSKKAGLIAPEACHFKRFIGLCLQETPAEVFALRVENDPTLSRNPVEVTRVVRGSPASQAGIKVGDVIMQINFIIVQKLSDFILNMKDENDIVMYARNGKKMSATLK